MKMCGHSQYRYETPSYQHCRGIIKFFPLKSDFPETMVLILMVSLLAVSKNQIAAQQDESILVEHQELINEGQVCQASMQYSFI